MPWYDDYYYMVEKAHGLEITKQVVDSYQKCIDWIEQVVKDEGIDCHFNRVDGHLFPHEESDDAYESLKKVKSFVLLNAKTECGKDSCLMVLYEFEAAGI